jgi:hypothetical protein
MNDPPILASATALAQRIRARELSAHEVVCACLARIAHLPDRWRLAGRGRVGRLAASAGRTAMSERSELIVVRHDETRANLEGRWQGQGDSPLLAPGRELEAGDLGGHEPL